MAVRDLIPRIRSRTPLVRSESVHPLEAFHREVNQLLDTFWRDFDRDDRALGGPYSFPHVELSETDQELKVEAELPGLEEKDVEVLLADGVLTRRGEKRSEREDDRRRVSERYYGRFERQIALPSEVEEDEVNATFKRVVLTITLPKTAQAAAKVKRIPIFGK